MAGAYPLMEKLAALANIDRVQHVGRMHNPVAVSPDGESQHRIRRMPCQLRHRTGLHGG